MKGRLTISRNSHGEILIIIRDEASRANFATVTTTPEVLGLALTGMSEQEVGLTVQHLDRVGKKRVSEARSIICPLDTYDRAELQVWLDNNGQEEGWILDSYLRTQSSVERLGDGGRRLNYSVFKFVEQEGGAS